MPERIEIRALAPADDLGGFRSGNDDLDRFFHRFAGQNQFRHHLGVTYVAVEAEAIIGFVTVKIARSALRLPLSRWERDGEREPSRRYALMFSSPGAARIAMMVREA